MSDFKRTTGGVYTTRDKPRLTVYTTGYGRINKCATELYLNSAEGAEVHLDEERQTLEIKPRTAVDNGTYTLTRIGGGAVISVGAMLRNAGLNIDALDESVPLPLAFDGETARIVADLKPLYAALERAELERPDIDHDAIVAELEDGVDDETDAMIPDGWGYDGIAVLCKQYDDVYSVADELGLSRAKGAYLLRKLGLLDYMGQSPRGDAS